MTPREKIAGMLQQTLTTARDQTQRARVNLANEIAVDQGALEASQRALAAKQARLLELDAELGELGAQILSMQGKVTP